MKNIFFTLAIIMLLTGTIFTGCQSPAQKEESAEVKLQAAEAELETAHNESEAQKIATAEEWEVFKSEIDLKIKKNEIRIAELKIQINKPGTTFDALYQKRIESLEQKNKDLKIRMESYEKSQSQSDWGKFKREFNADMDELGQSLKDFTVDSKK